MFVKTPFKILCRAKKCAQLPSGHTAPSRSPESPGVRQPLPAYVLRLYIPPLSGWRFFCPGLPTRRTLKPVYHKVYKKYTEIFVNLPGRARSAGSQCVLVGRWVNNTIGPARLVAMIRSATRGVGPIRYGLRRWNDILWAPRPVASFRSAYRDGQFRFDELIGYYSVGGRHASPDALSSWYNVKTILQCRFQRRILPEP